MNGWLKSLVATACIVIIAGSAWSALGEMGHWVGRWAEVQRANDQENERTASNDLYVKCRDSLHSSALGEAKRLRDWCRQNDYITYAEQLKAEGAPD